MDDGILLGYDSSPEENDKSLINVPAIPSFNLDQLNLVELCGQLRDSLNQPRPTFIFTSERRNRKLELERDRVRTVLEILETTRSINSSLAQARAEILLSRAVSESIIKDYFTARILKDEIQKETHAVTVDTLKDQREAIKDGAKSRQLQLEAAEISNLRSRAEINQMEAHTKEAHAKADLVKYVVENIDLKNMPQILQSFVIQSIINPHGQGNITDLELQGELKQYIKQEREAQAGKAFQEMRKVKSDADIAEMDVDRNKRNMEKLK